MIIYGKDATVKINGAPIQSVNWEAHGVELGPNEAWPNYTWGTNIVEQFAGGIFTFDMRIIWANVRLVKVLTNPRRYIKYRKVRRAVRQMRGEE
jgi:hypothetical protein